MRNRIAEKRTDKIIEHFQKERKAQGLSHEKLAELAGIHRSTISLIENRKREPTLLTCLKIANALGIKFSDFVKVAED
jgi:transcriptional regulator with XRE-family HTH domain